MSTVHVYPVGDLVEHDTSGTSGEACPCGPSTQAIFRDDGSNGWLITHLSLDGREERERMIPPPVDNEWLKTEPANGHYPGSRRRWLRRAAATILFGVSFGRLGVKATGRPRPDDPWPVTR